MYVCMHVSSEQTLYDHMVEAGRCVSGRPAEQTNRLTD